MKRYIYCLLLILSSLSVNAQNENKPYVIVLGVAQDGGYPHMGCSKQCCNKAWTDPSMKRNVVSLALVDPATKQWWLFEATPDIKEQLHNFNTITKGVYGYLPTGIFITHAHIGHYTGLMELGKEVMASKNVPVYVLPRMDSFLTNNGPWSQLVQQHNIALHSLITDSNTTLAAGITVNTFTIPHRDEYSETAGFKIITSGKKYLFIPDINKWQKWDKDIVKEVNDADIAFVDATFYDSTELPGRNMREVPHPLVSETMQLFDASPLSTRSKVWFIHFNHTNPLLWDKAQQIAIKKKGYNVTTQGQRL